MRIEPFLRRDFDPANDRGTSVRVSTELDVKPTVVDFDHVRHREPAKITRFPKNIESRNPDAILDNDIEYAASLPRNLRLDKAERQDVAAVGELKGVLLGIFAPHRGPIALTSKNNGGALQPHLATHMAVIATLAKFRIGQRDGPVLGRDRIGNPRM